MSSEKTSAVPGMRFQVSDPVEVRKTNGQVRSRYLPGMGYQVTKYNRERVQEMLDSGVATPYADGARARENLAKSGLVAQTGTAPAGLVGRVKTGDTK